MHQHLSLVSVFLTGCHRANTCSDSSVVCAMDALTETFLPPTPTQCQKAGGKRRACSVSCCRDTVSLSCTGDCHLLYEGVKFYVYFFYKTRLHK